MPMSAAATPAVATAGSSPFTSRPESRTAEALDRLEMPKFDFPHLWLIALRRPAGSPHPEEAAQRPSLRVRGIELLAIIAENRISAFPANEESLAPSASG